MRYISARQMVFEAYQTQRDSVLAGAIQKARWGVDVQMSQRNNNDWRIVHGLEAGAVIAIVESLPAHLRAQALYCFGPYTRDEIAAEAETVQLSLYRHLLSQGIKCPGQGKGLPTADMLETLRYLCAAALYHHAETTWPYLRQGLPTPQSVQRYLFHEHGIDVDVHRWSREGRACWGMVWERMLRVLDSWEAMALAPVAELIPAAA